MTRWNLVISETTDKSLRSFLGRHGARKGDLSRFVDEAVRSRLFDLTVAEVKSGNADADPEEMQQIIDAAVTWARSETKR